MRTTASIDDELFDKAIQLCEPGIDKSEVIGEAIRTFVRVQSAKSLAALGAKSPKMEDIPRCGSD